MAPKYAYIIGIAGKTTAALAKMLVDKGYIVKGSDQNCYPPMSTYLDDLGIEYHTPYHKENLTGTPDFVVIGGNALIVDQANPEYLCALDLGLRIISYPEVLAEHVIKETSIVVCGTYGKTTITALTAWMLERAGKNPSFMIGAIPLNFESGIRATDSNISVVEGDEHPTLNFDMRPKFVHYSPTMALITAAKWDHINVYKEEEDYIRAYTDLVKNMAKENLLIACLDGDNMDEVISSANCKVLTYYMTKSADYMVENVSYDNDYTRFTINGNKCESSLIGEHNIQNALGVYIIADYLDIPFETYNEALKTFKGTNRHFELCEVVNGVVIMQDIAQTPVKIQETLHALRTRYKQRIFVILHPWVSDFRSRKQLEKLPGVFDSADEVFVLRLPHGISKDKSERVTGVDLIKAIRTTQPNVSYSPKTDLLLTSLKEKVNAGDLVVFLSSGPIQEHIDNFVSLLKSSQ